MTDDLEMDADGRIQGIDGMLDQIGGALARQVVPLVRTEILPVLQQDRETQRTVGAAIGAGIGRALRPYAFIGTAALVVIAGLKWKGYRLKRALAPRESATAPALPQRSNPSNTDLPWAEVKDHRSPRGLRALGDLIDQRAPKTYRVQVEDAGFDAQTFKRHGFKPSKEGLAGDKLDSLFSIPRLKLRGLVLTLMRSEDDDETSLAAMILEDLHIRLV